MFLLACYWQKQKLPICRRSIDHRCIRIMREKLHENKRRTNVTFESQIQKVIMELAHSTICYSMQSSYRPIDSSLSLALSFSEAYINPIYIYTKYPSISFFFLNIYCFCSKQYCKMYTKQCFRHKSDQSATVACYIDKKQRCSSTISK